MKHNGEVSLGCAVGYRKTAVSKLGRVGSSQKGALKGFYLSLCTRRWLEKSRVLWKIFEHWEDKLPFKLFMLKFCATALSRWQPVKNKTKKIAQAKTTRLHTSELSNRAHVFLATVQRDALIRRRGVCCVCTTCAKGNQQMRERAMEKRRSVKPSW